MTLRLTEAARDDLRAIYAYHAQRTSSGADRVIGAIFRAANGLTLYPLLGRPGAIEGTRQRLLTRFPYRIVYRVEPDTIAVLRVMHRAHQWP